MSSSHSCSVQELHSALENKDDCLMLDVREDVEYDTEYIPGTQHIPLSALYKRISELDLNRKIYVVCATGNRAQKAADQLTKNKARSVLTVKGGMTAWKNNGFSVAKGNARVWAIDRQVRGAAGALVLIGLILAYAVHPYFIGISAFVACGLVFSALTNTCGMAMLLAKMPWNKKTA